MGGGEQLLRWIFFSGLEKWLKLLYPNVVKHSGGACLQEFWAHKKNTCFSWCEGRVSLEVNDLIVYHWVSFSVIHAWKQTFDWKISENSEMSFLLWDGSQATVTLSRSLSLSFIVCKMGIITELVGLFRILEIMNTHKSSSAVGYSIG